MNVENQKFGRLTAIVSRETRACVSKNQKIYYDTKWLCRCDCGQLKEVRLQHLRSGKTTSCGCYRREVLRKVHRTKEGRYINKFSGYVMLHHTLARKLYPDAMFRGSVITEHRAVMSHVLKRVLKKTESVHHKNGIRTDNAPDNLELWSNAAHSHGQRVEDKIAWAIQFLVEQGFSISKI